MSHAALLQRRVLVLDSRWVPVNLITARQALSLLLSCGLPKQAQSGRPRSLDSFRAMWLNLSDMSTHTATSEWAVSSRPPPRSRAGERHEEAPAFIASPNLHIRVPEAIVLGSCIMSCATRKPVPFARRLVLERDNHRCAYCGASASTIDHVVPLCLGGQTSFRNCVACCRSCNSKKSSIPLKDSGLRLRREVKLIRPDSEFFTKLRISKFNVYWTALLTSSMNSAPAGAMDIPIR
jgi:5-methylcytosine-specific restriction endonuclease McrA